MSRSKPGPDTPQSSAPEYLKRSAITSTASPRAMTWCGASYGCPPICAMSPPACRRMPPAPMTSRTSCKARHHRMSVSRATRTPTSRFPSSNWPHARQPMSSSPPRHEVRDHVLKPRDEGIEHLGLQRHPVDHTVALRLQADLIALQFD